MCIHTAVGLLHPAGQHKHSALGGSRANTAGNDRSVCTQSTGMCTCTAMSTRIPASDSRLTEYTERPRSRSVCACAARFVSRLSLHHGTPTTTTARVCRSVARTSLQDSHNPDVDELVIECITDFVRVWCALWSCEVPHICKRARPTAGFVKVMPADGLGVNAADALAAAADAASSRSALKIKIAIALIIAVPAVGVIIGSIVGASTRIPNSVRVGALGFTTGLEVAALAVILFPHVIEASHSKSRWGAFGVVVAGFLIGAALFLLMRAFINRWKPDATNTVNWPVVGSITADFVADGIVIGLAAASDPWRAGIAILVAYFIDGFFLAATQLSGSSQSPAGERAGVVLLFIVARLAPALAVYFTAKKIMRSAIAAAAKDVLRFEERPWGQILIGFALSAYASVIDGLGRETATGVEGCVYDPKRKTDVVDPDGASRSSIISMIMFLVAVLMMMTLVWHS